MGLEDHVHLASAEGTARITMTRPHVLNALSREMFRDLTKAIRISARNPAVNFIVISGAGKAFSAGLDIVQVGAFTPTVARRFVYGLVKPFWDVFLLECRKPIISVVNGPAYGAGAELALFSDLVVASEKAKFAFSGGRVGALCCISGFLGPLTFNGRKMLEMNLTGEPVSAIEAFRLGLVNYVTSEHELDNKVDELLSSMKQTSPDSNASLKRIRAGSIPKSSFRLAYDELYKTLTTTNFRKGSKAFIDKTRPNFYKVT